MAKTNYSEVKISAARTALFNNIKDVIEEINIHEVLKLSSGVNLPTHQMIDGKFPVFGGGGSTNLTHNNFNVDFGTLAIGRVGARCGCVYKVPKQSWVTDNALYALTFDERFNLDYLIHYLNYVDLNQYANRAAQPVISLKRISSIHFPLVTKEKQLEFVEIIYQVEQGKTSFGNDYTELNNALNSVDSINQLQVELNFQLTQLENLNQAILQEAVQGKLVAQDATDEPASELLKRIKSEKAKSGKKEKPLPLIKPEDIPFEIPASWVWCRLGEISNIVRGGSPRPAGDKTYYDGSIPFLKVGDLTDGNDVYLYKHTFTIKEAGLYKTRFVEANTLMLTNSGATLGYPKICTFPTTFNDGIAAFLDLSEDFDKVYLFYFLKSLTNWFLKEASRGQGQPNLNTDIIGFTPFPIPPKQEQKRIVAEIEKQLAKTKQLKEHIISNQQATEQLLKALLHQAFEVEEMEEL